ncbi:MAG: tetratricopeptide repeat protein [bacterium]
MDKCGLCGTRLEMRSYRVREGNRRLTVCRQCWYEHWSNQRPDHGEPDHRNPEQTRRPSSPDVRQGVQDSSSEDHFERGLECKRTGNWAEAIRHLARSVELDPTRAEAYFELGEAYSAIEDREKAQEAYQDAVAARPDLVKANLKLAELYESQGATDRVVDLFHRAIEVDPDSVRSHYYTRLFMELAFGSGDSYHRVVAAYQRAAASQPNRASIHYNLGRILSRRYEASGQDKHL